MHGQNVRAKFADAINRNSVSKSSRERTASARSSEPRLIPGPYEDGIFPKRRSLPWLATERSLHTGEVAGSIPAAPTIFQALVGTFWQSPAERYANTPPRLVERAWNMFALCLKISDLNGEVRDRDPTPGHQFSILRSVG
jgi:hypothetical protein